MMEKVREITMSKTEEIRFLKQIAEDKILKEEEV